MPHAHQLVRVWASKPVWWKVVGCLALAGVFAASVMLNFAAATMRRSPPEGGGGGFASGLSGAMGVLAFMQVVYALMLARQSARVIVGDDGVTVESWLARRFIPWGALAEVRKRTAEDVFGQKRAPMLDLLGRRGERLASLPGSLPDFDALAALVVGRAAGATGGPAYDPERQRQALVAEGRKKARRLAVISSLLLIAFGSVAVFATREWVRERRLTTTGQVADAAVVRRFMRAVTPYVEYELTAGGATVRDEAMVTPGFYDSVEEGGTVPVRYDPSDPTNCRLESGSAETDFGGGFTFLAWGITSVAALGLWLGMTGRDIVTEDGKLKVKRLTDVGPTDLQPPGTEAARTPPPLEQAATDTNANTVPMPPRRIPVGLVVLGVVAVAIGLLWMGAAAVRIAMQLAGPREVELPGGDVMVIEPVAGVVPLEAASLVVGLAAVVVGIGLLAMRSWARPLGIAAAVLSILLSIVALVLIVRLIADQPEIAGPAGTSVRVANLSLIFGNLLGLVFPIALLAVLCRRDVAVTLREWRDVGRGHAPT